LRKEKIKMLKCPSCKSKRLKVLAIKPTAPQYNKRGKTRNRQCLDCDNCFLTLEIVFEPVMRRAKLVTIKQPTKEKSPKKFRSSKPEQSLAVEPDWDTMTDEEIEDFIS